eukprot:CAMPEP_0171952240 /NCGR_PEP_ID=MMETSP0993-20121228/89404_1 /TAXON_ID=483369 /ORGANISM="non described non described, Strain CCMP2098" /LENGTH=298 /DNA_ID=CAMNT_0012597631 /DNA_START=110 /DNA_END=1006 /DNA_ORIENTATION=+
MAAALAMSKRILVTGANKGIGKAIAKKILSDYPDTFVYLGSRDQGRGEAACSDLVSELGSATCDGRLQSLEIDVTCEASVSAAAAAVVSTGPGGGPLYGLVNNAGVGFGRTIEETLATNLFGARRVTEAFLPLISDGGRVVNIASASGPNFVSSQPSGAQPFWSDPACLPSWEELEAALGKLSTGGPDYDGIAYGLSKASLNVYTRQVALREEGRVFVNSCTPGYIATDLTKGMGATNSPEKGTVAPLACLFGPLPPDSAATQPSVAQGSSGRYYGSDGVRSPLHFYRGPGDPPYEGP